MSKKYRVAQILETASLMLSTSALEEDFSQEGGSEDDDYYVVSFLCDEYYLVSTCMAVVSKDRFCKINEESCTFGNHGRVEF